MALGDTKGVSEDKQYRPGDGGERAESGATGKAQLPWTSWATMKGGDSGGCQRQVD